MSPPRVRKRRLSSKVTTPARSSLQTPPSDRVAVIYASEINSRKTSIPGPDKQEPPSPSPALPSRLQRKKPKITLNVGATTVKPRSPPGRRKSIDGRAHLYEVVAADLYRRERKLREQEIIVKEREAIALQRENEVHFREIQALNSWHCGIELAPTSRYEYDVNSRSIVLHPAKPGRHYERWWGQRPKTMDYECLGGTGKQYKEYDRALFERESVVHHCELNVVRREWELVRREAACSTHELKVLQGLNASLKSHPPSPNNLFPDHTRVFPLIYPQPCHPEFTTKSPDVQFNEKHRKFTQSGFPLIFSRDNTTSGYVFLDWQRLSHQVSSLPHEFPHPTYSGYPIPHQIIGYVKMVLTLAGIPYSNIANDANNNVVGFACNGGTKKESSCEFGCEIEFDWGTWDYRVKRYNFDHSKGCLLVPQMEGIPDISQCHPNAKDIPPDSFTDELVDISGDYLTYMSCLPPMTGEDFQAHLKTYFAEVKYPQAARCLVSRKWSK
ncbi:hypothetical protein DIURU_000719 [Diutina rugosa]|uniref:Uncharacterized protein n=1 Tax=Diutina rugosa TaxID=5481 RepID=A0A642UWY6_DIURU|nr:uncharacterized protein DIURU_000719 [Diutina rugosa]KAA8907035.1 hypothetical protein DIURU_000719 [Diutina rugosa]